MTNHRWRKATVERFSTIDIPFLMATRLESEKAIQAEAIKSGMTPRGVRRAIRKAIQRGHTDLSRLIAE